MTKTSSAIELQRSQILDRFRGCVMPDGKLPRPIRYGQAVALLAQLYGMYELELRQAGDVVPSPQFAELKRQIEKFIGGWFNEEQLRVEIDQAEELWNELKDASP
jgi:hypothetical protein